MNHFLTYAIDRESGHLVYVKNVPRGLACGCICPKCGEPLIAKRGDVRKPHFAHKADSVCSHEGAFESEVHQLCKEIIKENLAVAVPALIENGKERQPALCIGFDKVDIEEEVENGLRPDCIGYYKMNNGTVLPIWIEINYTHQVGEEKQAIIKRDNIMCLEIDVHQFSECESIDKAELQKYLLTDVNPFFRRWINYSFPHTTKAPVKQVHQRDPKYIRFGNRWVNRSRIRL